MMPTPDELWRRFDELIEIAYDRSVDMPSIGDLEAARLSGERLQKYALVRLVSDEIKREREESCRALEARADYLWERSSRGHLSGDSFARAADELRSQAREIRARKV